MRVKWGGANKRTERHIMSKEAGRGEISSDVKAHNSIVTLDNRQKNNNNNSNNNYSSNNNNTRNNNMSLNNSNYAQIDKNC